MAKQVKHSEAEPVPAVGIDPVADVAVTEALNAQIDAMASSIHPPKVFVKGEAEIPAKPCEKCAAYRTELEKCQKDLAYVRKLTGLSYAETAIARVAAKLKELAVPAFGE